MVLITKQVVFQVNAPAGQEVGGVRVTEVVDDPAPFRMEYQPGHPFADEKGYVRMPNAFNLRVNKCHISLILKAIVSKITTFHIHIHGITIHRRLMRYAIE